MAKTPGAKMMFLIRRREGIPHEELVLHWFKNHMPGVIENQARASELGRNHARRYIAALFDDAMQVEDGSRSWDGVAQLWFDAALPATDTPFGDPPADTFQQKAEPYWSWATQEDVVIDDGGRLAPEPLTLNEPWPATRSGFWKITYLVGAKDDADYPAFFTHWTDVHAPNVKATMERSGGIRYVVSQSLDPYAAPYAGMAELWFEDESGWQEYQRLIRADGMEAWVDMSRTATYRSRTEMIGIP